MGLATVPIAAVQKDADLRFPKDHVGGASVARLWPRVLSEPHAQSEEGASQRDLWLRVTDVCLHDFANDLRAGFRRSCSDRSPFPILHLEQ